MDERNHINLSLQIANVSLGMHHFAIFQVKYKLSYSESSVLNGQLPQKNN